MTVTAQGSTYIWKGAFNERSIPEQAGFVWTTSYQWTTQRHGIAAKLRQHFDKEASALANRAAESESIDSDFVVPAPEGQAFLPYQRAGIGVLHRRFLASVNCLLADEMRIGKSIETIGLINVYPDILTILIVCPASLKLHWKAELQKWLTVPMSIGVMWPDTKTLPTASIIITNYDLLHKFIWPHRDLVVLDEAHMCKNPKTRRAKKAMALRARHKIYLTGTPVLSRPIELYPLIKSLDPRNWPSRSAFGMRYCDGFIGDYGGDFTGASNLEELHDKLRSTIMVRRLRSEVWKDLPIVRREIIEMPAGKGVLKRETELTTKIKTVGDLATARRIAFEDMSLARHETALAKAPQVVEFINEALEANDEKIVVFCHHKDMVDKLLIGLAAFNPVVVTGDTPVATRKERESFFLTRPERKVFIGNLVAAGLGLDLSVSSRIVFAELDWVPGIMSQCESRCQNPAKRDSVLVQHLVLESSIDALMAKTLVRKQDILDRTLDGKGSEPINWADVFLK